MNVEEIHVALALNVRILKVATLVAVQKAIKAILHQKQAVSMLMNVGDQNHPAERVRSA